MSFRITFVGAVGVQVETCSCTVSLCKNVLNSEEEVSSCESGSLLLNLTWPHRAVCDIMFKTQTSFFCLLTALQFAIITLVHVSVT